jgi:cytochrome c-type biogenesis protein
VGGVQQIVQSGPLMLAIPVAAAAGAITVLSPCCLPLVPGYLSYVTGMSGADVQQAGAGPAGRARRGRTVAGAALFVTGFSAVFATDGLIFGSLGAALRGHLTLITQVLGVVTTILGLMFAGVFDRFPTTGRIMRPSVRPEAGLAGAPLLGVLFALSWTPCAGPTLAAVLATAYISETAIRGPILAFT